MNWYAALILHFRGERIMNYRRAWTVIALSAVCGALLILSCTKKPRRNFYPVVDVVVGDCKVMPEGREAKSITKGMQLSPGNVVIVPDDSKLKLTVGNENGIYLNENTELSIEAMNTNDGTKCLHLNFSKGEMYSALNDIEALQNTFSISTGNAAFLVRENAHFALYYMDNRSLVISLHGKIACTPRRGDEFVLPSCQKALIDASGVLKTGVARVDEENLATWVSKSAIASSLARSGCTPVAGKAENLPPIWIEEPQAAATVGKMYRDTLFARDPESTKVVFSLAEAPRGMLVDSISGILKFTPEDAGNFPVLVLARDAGGETAELRFTLNVEKQEPQLRAYISCPKQASPGEALTIDASRSQNEPAGMRGLVFRFDVDGDGKWDYPSGGGFGKNPRVKHTYARQGEYRIKAQIKNSEGARATTGRKIIVNSSPVAQISVTPSSGTIGTEFTFDASGSTDGKKPADELSVRWDFDGDGSWDYPQEKGFAKEKTAQWSWEKQGNYIVTCEVRDRYGAVASTKITVTVSEALEIQSIEGPDSAGVGQKLTFVCNLVSSDTGGIMYSWNFHGDEKPEQEGPGPKGTVQYDKEGTYSITCTVKDREGRIAQKSKTITITNAPPVVDAMGPYKVQVNSMLSVVGKASDPDNTIVSYSWDFDNDAKDDWSSSEHSRASFSYKSAGEYIARLTVKTDDGKSAVDSAQVIVFNEPPRAFAGEDVISRKNRDVLLKGTGKDKDGTIAKYEWDFDNDGTFDWSSGDTGYVEHEFAEFSTAVLKVTDADGETGYDTIRIVICPDGMEPVREGKFCIDRYEWPNERNEEPVGNITWKEAARKCASVGKRLCSSAEWELACSGGGRKKYVYPYGNKFDVEKCNTLGNSWSDNKPTKCGKYPECESRYDAADMSGNYAEWTSGGTETDAYVYGGSWQSTEKDSRCTSRVLLSKDRKYFYVSFRCCK
ncbi:MAG: PKD domain-containing protein [Chitinivibrionales bacterium]|nr:PKD domain-containing protein [Chitinivibrionales bacterium]